MFRQILVDPVDRDLQKVVWRENERQEIKEYRLNTVTYGLASAPFLAMRTIKQLAEDEAKQFPEAAAVLRQDIYMDDILTGAPSISEARRLRQQLQDICMAGGFPLRKWSSNKAELLEEVPPQHRMQQDLRAWHAQESHATLGLLWHPGRDSFTFSTRRIGVSTITKRSVLSLMSRLFDPLGWLAPTVVRAKILFQATWLKGLDWDVPLADQDERRWLEFQAGLPKLEEITVPRYLLPGAADSAVQFHGFGDASERAYAAVVYMLTGSSEEGRAARLVMAKTKVAPLRQVTLPRLELCAASLLARLVAHVVRTLGYSEAPVHLWTDSTVVLGWIQGHSSSWRTYVANRVADIQTTMPNARWHHVPGSDNPADCASRGLAPEELASHRLWWRGPPWMLKDATAWPDTAARFLNVELPEARSGVHHAPTRPAPTAEPEELTRFSSLQRLLRVTSWCLRWPRHRRQRETSAPLLKDSPLRSVLSVGECEEARRVWIRVSQAAHFKAELDLLERGERPSTRGSLARLTPFLDDRGLLRVGGRLRHSLLAYDEKHPILLPGASHFTRLVVEACHRRTLHGGVQLTLGLIRQTYWIPQGRSLVKSVLHRCVTCIRWRAAIPQQLMGDLPRPRVRPARPFHQTGVDYAGPIWVRTTKGRGQRAHKAFIAVFVCLSTKAVHLEVVSDYTADAFLAALRRFTSRRGLCRILYSDCGTNFVGADSQLRSFFTASHPEQRRLAEQLAHDQIQWRFQPPAAPHFGGIWEAAVKSFKYHLRRVLGEATLTYEEMSTLLAQIEACLNSRPLQALSDDPDDLAALTPGHFLIGSALNAVPESSLMEVPTSRLTRWQHLQQMRDHFWERWSNEYLHSLLQRPKWLKASDQLRVGQLCLIRNEATPPTRWPLARIVKVHPGEDGRVRVVTVRTATSELTRPIVKIVLLPEVEDNDKETST